MKNTFKLPILFCFSLILITSSLKASFYNKIEDQIEKSFVCKKKPSQTFLLDPCTIIAQGQVTMMHDYAYTLLQQCLDGGFTNCARRYKNFTAAGMAAIEAQAETCLGDGHAAP